MNSFLELLPDSLKENEDIVRFAKIIDGELKAVNKNIDKILIYPKIDKMDEAIINELAYSFHLQPNEGYRFAKTLEEKRELVKGSLNLHKYKGTRWAVENVLEILNINAEIVEWFEYGGEPFHFKVIMFFEQNLKEEELYIFYEFLKEFKNVRSHLEGFQSSNNILGEIFFAGVARIGQVINLSIDLSPVAGVTQIETTTPIYVGVAINIKKTITIGA